MATGGGAPPPEAVRGAKGVSAIVTVVVAVLTFVAGIGLGYFIAPAPVTGPPRLLLGTSTPFPPFEYYNNTTSGRALVGFDIELVQTLVTRSGYTYEWRDYTDFTALLLAVGSNGVDIAIGAITESGTTGTQRNASMHFTNPYYLSNQGVLKRASDTTNYCAATTTCTCWCGTALPVTRPPCLRLWSGSMGQCLACAIACWASGKSARTLASA